MTISPAKHSPAERVVREALHNVVEGKRAWGVVDIPLAVSRSGWDRYGLTVYPPGTNVSERRALTFYRRWPLGGALVLLVIELIAGAVSSSLAIAIALAVVYVAGIVAALVVTRKLRKRVRKLFVAVVMLGGGRQVVGNRRLFERSVSTLDDLDVRFRNGYITPAQYEAGWAAVYDELGSESAEVSATPGTPEERGRG